MSPPADLTGPRDIVLADPEGSPVRLVDLAADPLVVVLVRYFGCLPCQAFLADVDQVADQLPAGARVIAVGGSADFQARWLRDSQGVRMPLLLDPDQRVRRLVGLGNLRLRQLLSARGAANYARAMRRGLRPQKVTRDTVRAPGVALLSPDLEVLWTYEGRMLGDYPQVSDLLARAEKLVGGRPA